VQLPNVELLLADADGPELIAYSAHPVFYYTTTGYRNDLAFPNYFSMVDLFSVCVFINIAIIPYPLSYDHPRCWFSRHLGCIQILWILMH
jgi:hypothetical protein